MVVLAIPQINTPLLGPLAMSDPVHHSLIERSWRRIIGKERIVILE
jgi:hypothetical protein